MATQQPVLEYLANAKIGGKGQITVPKQFREDLGLASGARLAILRIGDGLILLPEQHRLDRLCNAISSALTDSGATVDDLLDSLPRMRELVFAKRYGRPATKKGSPRVKSIPRR